ncbi:DUF4142 domain-containing protein [Roseisolibacter sp. H3M3-2]|uniref:DUF4142 domain-containing protein n=1 Tax=Roseisolibacter sp. H3M3-2 TaxID=3031323 RepID=UPI0023DB424F|nr:DUF4142 domain-containing protein [Roseisolibacter sp. H3M3-2]MDF1504918.1 DUF4142 domain-containing protein [Roseisolibacter sp. H3M3-2]
MHHRAYERTACRAARARVAPAPRTATRDLLALAAAALTALAAMGITGCGGGDDVRGSAPARSGASGGEVAVPGATASVPDTAFLPGTAGSSTAAVGNAGGAIGTPGSGAVQSGDPSDAAVRSLLDAINAGETEASTVAATKAQHAEVRRYAQAMLAAHRQPALDRGIEAAGTNSANDLIVPLTDAHRKTMQQLQSLDAGPAFDRAYMTAQVQAHEGALQALERAETAAGDATLVDRVRRAQGDVERHLAEARRVQALVQSNAARGGRS